jgi:hypothetical protein
VKESERGTCNPSYRDRGPAVYRISISILAFSPLAMGVSNEQYRQHYPQDRGATPASASAVAARAAVWIVPARELVR